MKFSIFKNNNDFLLKFQVSEVILDVDFFWTFTILWIYHALTRFKASWFIRPTFHVNIWSNFCRSAMKSFPLSSGGEMISCHLLLRLIASKQSNLENGKGNEINVELEMILIWYKFNNRLITCTLFFKITSKKNQIKKNENWWNTFNLPFIVFLCCSMSMYYIYRFLFLFGNF